MFALIYYADNKEHAVVPISYIKNSDALFELDQHRWKYITKSIYYEKKDEDDLNPTGYYSGHVVEISGKAHD